MNFFEQQERARKNTVILVTLFLLFALCITSFLVYLVSLSTLDHHSKQFSLSPVYVFTHAHPLILASFFIISLSFIAYNSTQKVRELARRGGWYIVNSLHGRLCTANSASVKEKVLLNVVEEIAIASGVSPPPVYILDEGDAINAFAVGNNHDDAIIGVTAGAVEHLTRAELQGVIAHEFSHIFNGDMRLNILTIGILNGISAIGLAGENRIKSAFKTRKTLNPEAESEKVGNIVNGLFLYVIGYPGLFFGSIIKAAINREREFLADATAASFTRYPKGLADALKKIGGLCSFISSSRSNEFSHLYFANGSKFSQLSSHPPIDKRIYALDKNWDGIYILTEPAEAFYIKSKAEKLKTKAEYTRAAKKTSRNLDSAAKIIKNIPHLLHDGAANTPDAKFIIFAVLLDSDESIRKIQREIITEACLKDGAEKFNHIETESLKYPRDLQLNLVNLCIPTLKALPKEEYLKFKETVIKLIEADNKVAWRELNLKYLILYPLDISFGIRKPARESYIYIGSIKSDAEILLSKFTHHQFNDDEQARKAFYKTMKTFGMGALEYIPSQSISIADIERACDKAQKAKRPLRKKLLEISIACLKTDGELSAHDTETIHALSALLHLPIQEWGEI
jgi:Zn-dependent protease with chaperone function